MITNKYFTIEDYKRYHNELWTYLINNPFNNKKDWPKWDEILEHGGMINGQYMEYFCPLCAYMRKMYKYNFCNMCPLTENNFPSCDKEHSFYQQWKQAQKESNKDKAKNLATIIRDKWSI